MAALRRGDGAAIDGIADGADIADKEDIEDIEGIEGIAIIASLGADILST